MNKYLASAALLVALFTASPAHAKGGKAGKGGKGGFIQPPESVDNGPWFTGTLLSPSPNVVAPGHFYIEPYLYVNKTFGSYDDNWKSVSEETKWTTTVQLPATIGLVEGIDFSASAELIHTKFKGLHATEFGDMSAGIDFQIYKSSAGSPLPSIKLSVSENIPFGKFQNLDPTKLGIDGVGAGNWNTTVGVTFGDTYHLDERHYLNARLAFDYTIPFKTHVNGLNVYGGAPSTDGTAKVGGVYTLSFGAEYLFSKHLALAFDAIYSYANAVSFHGTTPALSPVGSGVAEQLSIAPAIEYNWNSAFGLIAGVHWTLAGRNTSQFTTYIVALSIYL